MKLIDFYQFEPFNRLRMSMGAPRGEAFIRKASSVISVADLEISIADIAVMETTGKDVELDEIRILEDGTLAYKNKRILLHIRDISVYNNNYNIPKFHVSDCKTLQRMRDQNRFERYVVSIRTDGKFNLNFFANNIGSPEIKDLNVCKHCLEFLPYKNYNNVNYAHKLEIVKNFSIDEYFKIYSRDLFSSKPRYTSADAPLNKYPDDMNRISKQYRSMQNFTCESCKIDLSAREHQRFLHTNHKNGQKYDCDYSNLEALCIYCHAAQPFHSHMKKHKDYTDFSSIRSKLKNKLDRDTTFSSGQSKTTNAKHDWYSKNEDVEVRINVAREIAILNGVKFDDFRSKSGAFWVLLDCKTGVVADKLRELSFNYKTGRGWWKK